VDGVESAVRHGFDEGVVVSAVLVGVSSAELRNRLVEAVVVALSGLLEQYWRGCAARPMLSIRHSNQVRREKTETDGMAAAICVFSFLVIVFLSQSARLGRAYLNGPIIFLVAGGLVGRTLVDAETGIEGIRTRAGSSSQRRRGPTLRLRADHGHRGRAAPAEGLTMPGLRSWGH
jgi:hypothetical protein